MAPLHLTIFAAAARPCLPAVRRGLIEAHRILRSPITELSLAIVPGRQMAVLHRRFLHQAGPTDVLTFELERDRRGRAIAGEIVVCSTIAQLRRPRTGASAGPRAAAVRDPWLVALVGVRR